MDPFAANSDTDMKGHNKRKREGGGCASSAPCANTGCNQEEKRKEKAAIVANTFDPFRALDRTMFGSVTDGIEVIRALKLKFLNHSFKMKQPTQSFTCSDMKKSKRRCFIDLEEEEDSQPAYQNVIDKQVSTPPVHIVDVTETLSDQSVTQPTPKVIIHLEDDHTGDDDKGVTMPILIIDSDDENDGIQRPSHQFHKAVQKGPASEPSMNNLMVTGSEEKEAPKMEVGSEAAKMDIGLNKSIDLCDSYVGVGCCVERKAPKEELGEKLDEIAFRIDESIDQVTSFSERKASKEVETVPKIDAASVKNTCIETDGNMMIKEDNDQIDIADDRESKSYEIVDQVTSCSERKASDREVEAVPKINVRSSKNTYIETDDNMMIEEGNDQIDNAYDMDSKPSENVDQVTSCSERKASEEVETVPSTYVRSVKNTCIETDGNMMIKENNDQIDVADEMGSKTSETVNQDTSCSKRKASEKVETVPNIDVMSAKNTYTETDNNTMIKEDSDQIEAADDRESKPSENAIELDTHVDHIERESSGEKLKICPNIAVMTDKGMYIGTNDDLVIQEDNNQAGTANDGLEDIWNEMKFALECSKDIAAVPIAHEQSEEDDDCDHSFVLKDDLGLVCRICGVIERSIETIFEFQYSKVKRTQRTYIAEPRNMSNRGLNEILHGANSIGDNSVLNEICVHPRHRKQMKPHQVDGFDFLCSNLLADDPGGCILAHAPGSGKTFMIISFIQSFLAKYPEGRPLVILPKGILGTWKKEFQTWQIEDIPLLDFYTLKAENRQQQLDVLLKWEKQKSILFLGYKQFSAIVCDNRSCKVAVDCQDKLLKVPSILFLDEGHTSRNEVTDVFQSLAKVRTPRKVILSGTLYQNNVKEVFNILNLVRPKFLKFKTSRDVVSRIMSKVQISGTARKHIKAGSDLAFFELVEYALQKDENLERKAAVIRDLREMTSNVLHYYKGDCLDELPGLIDFTIMLNLSAKQKEAVKKLKKLDKFTQNTVGSALYVHPDAARHTKCSVNNELIDQILEKIDERHGVKMKFFVSLLGLCESTGEKLLVFSQFLLPLKLLERVSVKSKGWNPGKEIFSLTGDSTHDQREWSMQRFNSSPDAKVFFGSLKACGEGISLVGASRILILDVHLNPSVTRQAIGRAFRPGQKRKVYTYRLVAADSPEEENHFTSFRKESISKTWFEWSESCQFRDFDMKTVDLDNCGDMFLESPMLQEDIKVLYKR